MVCSNIISYIKEKVTLSEYMKKYAIGLGLFLSSAYYIFDMNQQKNMKVEVKIHDLVGKIDKTVSLAKNKEHKNNQISNAKLEQIMSTKIEEPAATDIWSWLMKNGFGHPNSIRMLDDLLLVNGVRKYYKELIVTVKEDNLPDDVRSFIIRVVTSSFDGGFGTKKSLSEPANEKDIAIQVLIREELDYPKDKKSFFEALQAAGYLAEDNEIQEILNGLLEKDNPHIDKNDVYRRKISLVSSSIVPDSVYPVFQQVMDLDAKNRESIMEGFAEEGFASAVLRCKDDDLKDKYIKVLEDNLPKVPQDFDESNFDKYVEEKFAFPDNIVTDEQKQKYVEKEIPRLYEESTYEVSDNDKPYEDWIQAYALMVNKNDRYEFYKNKILKAETKAEKDAIAGIIYERSQYEQEYEVYADALDKDKQIQEVINGTNSSQ